MHIFFLRFVPDNVRSKLVFFFSLAWWSWDEKFQRTIRITKEKKENYFLAINRMFSFRFLQKTKDLFFEKLANFISTVGEAGRAFLETRDLAKTEASLSFLTPRKRC